MTATMSLLDDDVCSTFFSTTTLTMTSSLDDDACGRRGTRRDARGTPRHGTHMAQHDHGRHGMATTKKEFAFFFFFPFSCFGALP